MDDGDSANDIYAMSTAFAGQYDNNAGCTAKRRSAAAFK